MNCPARTTGAAPAQGSRTIVHVSAVSPRRATTRNGRGAVTPCPCSATSAVAIEVEEPEARPLQPLDQHLREPGGQVVAELRVVVALLPQAGAVEGGCADVRERARVEVAPVGAEEPRPADHLARLDGLDHDRPPRR